MARIDSESLQKIVKQRNSVHAKVNTTYSIVHDSGEKLIQIDTYGTNDRVMRGIVSQSLQIDRDTAQKLIEVFKKEFDL